MAYWSLANQQPNEAALVQAYSNHFNRQIGGLNVYSGSDFQSGQGIGSVLRGVGGFVIPIMARALGSFISNTTSALKEGKSIKSAAKSALKPTLIEGLSATGRAIGKKRRRKRQSGGGKKKRRRVYKGGRRVKRKKVKRRGKKLFRRSKKGRRKSKKRKHKPFGLSSNF